MGMEDTGLATKNANHIWIEPIDYIPNLCKAVKSLADWNMPVAIYNIPLCLLSQEYHQYAAKSISDWKTKYLDECSSCVLKDKCCGLFATSKSIFKGLTPINTVI